ncbi:MAG TPA: phospholipid carrier-dependent glycosyltransferase [Planctomycetota bacterium]
MESKRDTRLHDVLQPLLLALVAVLAYLPGIGRQEFVGTEDFRARIASEMLASGEWTRPTYYGRLILTKPPLHYWSLAGTMAWQGKRSPGSARLVSLAALALTVAVIGAAARAAAGATAGWVAGLGYLLGLNTLKNGVNAEIDPTFAALTVVALLALHGAGARRHGASAWMILAGLAAGLATLAKGAAVAPWLVGGLVAAWLLGMLPRRRDLLLGAATFLPLALLWPLVLRPDSATDPLGIRESFGDFLAWDLAALGRAFVYPLALLFAALPLSLPALLRLRAAGRASLDRYAVLAVAGAFVMLMAAGGKSTRYLLPAFPLLAVAGALRLELMAASGAFARVLGFAALVLAAAAVPWSRASLDLTGGVSLALLALAGAAAARIGPQRPALALLLLCAPARALYTQVAVPAWERSQSIAPALVELRTVLGDARRIAVTRLETPRLLEPLGVEIEYFDKPRQLYAALPESNGWDALLIPWRDGMDEPPAWRLDGVILLDDKELRVYRPPPDPSGG